MNTELENLYTSLIQAWNDRNAIAMASLFMDQGELIGFDGSYMKGRTTIEGELLNIFSHHKTAPFISKLKDIQFLSDEIALVRGIVGMTKDGTHEINPQVNAHQTLIAKKQGSDWKIALFQNTPAQFHGKPELVEEMTKELQSLIN